MTDDTDVTYDDARGTAKTILTVIMVCLIIPPLRTENRMLWMLFSVHTRVIPATPTAPNVAGIAWLWLKTGLI